ncbi:hypothetical protein Tco_0183949 [Tanacetum coccineum]
MRTRNSNYPSNSPVTIPRRRNRRRAPNVVEPELRTIVEVAPITERTMEELLRAPTEGYGEAIVIPEINADHFEIKTNLLQLVQASPFHRFEREKFHTILKKTIFKRITSTWESFSKTDERTDKLADQISTLVEIVSKKVVTPATVKAVEILVLLVFENESKSLSKWVLLLRDLRFLLIIIQKGSGTRNRGKHRIKEQTNFPRSTAHIPPPVNPILIPEPDVPKTLPKPNIPYPSRLNDQKFREKASNQMEKIFQIFQDLRFDISFADALLLMPRFNPTIKNLLMNKEKLKWMYVTLGTDLGLRAVNSYASIHIGKKLSPTDLPLRRMILSLRIDPLLDLKDSPKTSLSNDFILEEIEVFLKDDSILPEIDHADYDPEGDICLIEKLLNNDPFQLHSMDLKEATKEKSSIEEPPELELKIYHLNLEICLLRGTDSYP